tara:strand:- start:50565 stop:51404 length:840 start_codon:yes stop_codon:yes gene_type:complete
MFDKNLKHLSLLSELMQSTKPLKKLKAGFKLITRSSVDDAYDMLWLLNESVNGDTKLFSDKIEKLVGQAIRGKGVRFDVQKLCTVCPSEKIALAFKDAAGGHLGQNRKGLLARPYLHHILMVWFLVMMCGGDEAQQIVALLHDYSEDVPDRSISVETLSKHIRYKYGARVVKGCAYLCNKKGISGRTPAQAVEKHIWQLSHLKSMPKAWQLVKLCDRSCNMYDSRRDGPVGNTPCSIAKEIDQCEEFFAVCSQTPALLKEFSMYITHLLDVKYDLKHLN